MHLIIGFPAGSASDTLARIVGPWLTERVGQPVIVEAKPGASGNIAVQTALAAPADGYTVVQIAASNAINATLFQSLPFELLRDLMPVAGLAYFPFVLKANPALPARTVAELIALAKATPGNERSSPGYVRHADGIASALPVGHPAPVGGGRHKPTGGPARCADYC